MHADPPPSLSSLAHERRRMHLELARLARSGASSGAADARAALDRWAPRPHASTRVSRRAGLPPSVQQRAVTLAGDVTAARAVATDARLLLPTRTRLLALDPTSLSEAWSAPGQAWPATLRGDDVLHPGGAGLVLRDGARGEVLTELPLAGRVSELFVWGDRALVVHDAPGVRRVSALDVGAAPGSASLWTREWPTAGLDLVRLARQRVVLAGAGRVEVVDLETGRPLAGRALGVEEVLDADTRGLLTRSPSERGAIRVEERDLARLETRWHVDVAGAEVEASQGERAVALRVTSPGASSWLLVDRATGATQRPVGAPPSHELAWADDAVYALEHDDRPGGQVDAAGDPETTPAVTLTVHDPRTLERRAAHALSCAAELVDVVVVPFAGAAVVVLAHRDRTTLVRLGDGSPGR